MKETPKNLDEAVSSIIEMSSQAANECFGASKELAEEIRQHRLMFMENINYPVPYYLLYNRVLGMIKDIGCGNCNKAKADFKQKIKEVKNEQKDS
jgi:hypothetical protein